MIKNNQRHRLLPIAIFYLDVELVSTTYIASFYNLLPGIYTKRFSCHAFSSSPEQLYKYKMKRMVLAIHMILFFFFGVFFRRYERKYYNISPSAGFAGKQNIDENNKITADIFIAKFSIPSIHILPPWMDRTKHRNWRTHTTQRAIMYWYGSWIDSIFIILFLLKKKITTALYY